MAKKVEKVSVNKLEQAVVNNIVTEEVLVGTEDVTIRIRSLLPLTDMLEFVDEVVNACVDIEEGEYIPQAYDFAIRVATVTKYANLRLPSSLEKQYLLVYGTTAFEQTLKNINSRQFNDILSSIDKKIKHTLDMITSTASAKFGELMDKFGEIANIGTETFGGVNAESMREIIEKLSKSSVDEEKIVDVITSASKKDSEDE